MQNSILTALPALENLGAFIAIIWGVAHLWGAPVAAIVGGVLALLLNAIAATERRPHA